MEELSKTDEFFKQLLGEQKFSEMKAIIDKKHNDPMGYLKDELEKMIQHRYDFTLESHYDMMHVSPFPIFGLTDMINVKSDRMKHYIDFQVKLKELADDLKIGKEEVIKCLSDLLYEKEHRVHSGVDGTQQIIVNVLYELGKEMSKHTSKRVHNKDYALNPKKVAEIWQGDHSIIDKREDFSK